jgi:hypothetical protein
MERRQDDDNASTSVWSSLADSSSQVSSNKHQRRSNSFFSNNNILTSFEWYAQATWHFVETVPLCCANADKIVIDDAQTTGRCRERRTVEKRANFQELRNLNPT